MTVRPLAPGLGSNGLYTTIGNSSYNALEASLKHQTGRMTFLASYTYSKALDDGSSEVDQVNPFNNRLSKGLSAYDMTHNFVFSYNYELPFDKLFRGARGARMDSLRHYPVHHRPARDHSRYERYRADWQ